MTSHSNKDAPYTHCGICSSLADYESAYQKYGHPQDDTSLPAAANSLQIVRELKQDSSRKLQIWQCPQCATSYLYRTDYEFFVNGSEDEEELTRLTAEAAAVYLAQFASE